MATTYATLAQYTAVYSDQFVGTGLIAPTLLEYGALRVNEELGGTFSIPFSTNNQTARDLSIHYARSLLLLRTRKQDDSEELLNRLDKRVTDIRCGNLPMVTDDGEALFAGANAPSRIKSTTENYKPVFDMRGPIDQRIDPDQIDDEWDADL